MSQEREEILQKEITSVQDENDIISLDQIKDKQYVQRKKYQSRNLQIKNQIQRKKETINKLPSFRLRRIQGEISHYEQNQIQGVKLNYNYQNPVAIYLTIQGPKGTPYYGAWFNYEMTFPDNYPFEPPIITSLQTVYHYSEYNCLLKGGCFGHAPRHLEYKSGWLPSYNFDRQIKKVIDYFYIEHFTDMWVDTVTYQIYLKDKEQFNKNVKSTIATEKAKEQVKQYLVFQKCIKQFLPINSDSVFIDLFF
ncbi:ubiquitin-conjugating enzyme E2 (macronuclear) [Tetrahymena thermophila SB210]|uniref:Ubiquitin-conjugating enzyme E2 n=1 Tax=Tetrahymena thermophila (strain SB210) TaxID=312017 RepID=Q22YU9_TETTS|nr:ubiquitin-conjugating enzyme E2 [Tetrahymena thermophila SB210]EAR90572.2 ubiquitin-conjugating enzyme E2 [Tetrahymena thermophila SB210]|eukprot:XP_001010817.2 ubiquitin-conjugating enzyme E2 [Tetrahymena thermophila SB210]